MPQQTQGHFHDQDQLLEYLREYSVVQNSYQVFCNRLEEILKKAVKRHAPMAIVQSRAKDPGSFIEKVVRKGGKYKNPVEEMTDLCGVRLIATTWEHCDLVAHFIRTNMVVDKANTKDKRRELGPNEFGYLAVHYVVQLEKEEILGVTIPDEVKGLKAEIQLRTFLEHAWSEITHDRLYKPGFKVPDYLKRKGAKTAALIEETSDSFGSIVSEVDAYVGSYCAQLSPEKAQAEIDKNDQLFSLDKGRQRKYALAIAKLSRSVSEWSIAIDRLEQVYEPEECDLDIAVELGRALLMQHQGDPTSMKFDDGIQILLKAKFYESLSGYESRSFLAQKAALFHALGFGYSCLGKLEKSRNYCFQAYELEHENPYYLLDYLYLELLCSNDIHVLPPVFPVIRKAIENAGHHIDLGFDTFIAREAISIGYLFLGETYNHLHATCQLFRESWNMGQDFHSHARKISDLSSALEGGLKGLSESVSFTRFLTAYFAGDISKAGRTQTRAYDSSEKIIIVVGSMKLCDSQKDKFKNALLDEMKEFKGSIVSGASNMGVCGVTGDVVETLNRSRKDANSIELIGYFRDRPNESVELHPSYDPVIKIGEDFSIEQPLQYWFDLLSSGINPMDVVVICYGGGDISKFECELARVLGAAVKLMAACRE